MTPMFAGSNIIMILVVVGGFLLFSSLLQRPLKKQAAQQAEMRRQVGEGSRVLLTSGIFGTVTHTGEEQLILEIAPGVEATVLKDAVKQVVAPEDEEFEYADPDSSGEELAAGGWRDAGIDGGDAETMQAAMPGTEEALGMPTPAGATGAPDHTGSGGSQLAHPDATRPESIHPAGR